jgi:hypothetical protein
VIDEGPQGAARGSAIRDHVVTYDKVKPRGLTPDWRAGFTITDDDVRAVADAAELSGEQRNKLAELLRPVRRTEAARAALRASKRYGG